jgi:hypothetical protein
MKKGKAILLPQTHELPITDYKEMEMVKILDK